jgi:hypothetical protein
MSKRTSVKRKMEKKRLPVRQGDVLLIPCGAVDAGDIEAAPLDARGIVLAEGESSGHFHSVVGRGAKLFRFRDERRTERLLILETRGDVRVIGGGSVPRHTAIGLAKGAYLVRTQRFWSAADERSLNVQD